MQAYRHNKTRVKQSRRVVETKVLEYEKEYCGL